MATRAGLGGCGEEKKLLCPLGFQLLTFQPVASCYTEYAILVPKNEIHSSSFG